MDESIFDAKQELKRVDHLIFVSLKYTRTVDVLKNVVERLISSLDFVLNAILENLHENEKIEEIPTAFVLKCDLIIEKYPNDEKIKELIDFFILLKKLNKLDYEKENEYRRHVGMIFNIDGKEIKINIDSVTAYYKKVKELISHIELNILNNNNNNNNNN
ncbi:MAG: hypothetical protein ACLFPJ_00270 [Candidatus Woesearchaeota archaeon]